MRNALLLVCVTFVACLPEDRQLLCREDGDCAADESCEVVSGLCKPAAQPSQFGADVETGAFGIAGAFECPIVEANMPGSGETIGRATVVLSMDLEENRVCDRAAMNMMKAPGKKITGLRTGCVVRRDPNRGVSPDDQRTYLELEFAQVDTTPDNPVARMKFTLREDDLAEGSLTIASIVHGRFSQRCKNNDGSTEVQLRAVADMGAFEVTAVDEGRIRGHFDVRLAMIETHAEKSFGDECAVTRDCADGCALEELGSTECTSGTCVPRRDDPSSGQGFCSSSCEDASDCDVASDPLNYCLQRPNVRFGQCIRLCDPNDESSCPTGQSCRAGDDFLEVFGQPGLARCLDECIPTPSMPNPPDGCVRPTPPASNRGDGGMPRSDAGVSDAGGPPPRDGGPPDAGVPSPRDGGTASSALGQTCQANMPCPAGWFCGSSRLNGTTMVGTCTKSCPGAGQDTVCQEGYAGPGVPSCGLMTRDVQSAQQRIACAIACGADMGGTGMCPDPLVCGDRVTNMSRMPPADGMPDYCVDP